MSAHFVDLDVNATVVLDMLLGVRKELAQMGSYADPQFAPALALMERETNLAKTLGWMLTDLAVAQSEQAS